MWLSAQYLEAKFDANLELINDTDSRHAASYTCCGGCKAVVGRRLAGLYVVTGRSEMSPVQQSTYIYSQTTSTIIAHDPVSMAV